MSLAQGFPNTFTGQVTNQVTKNHELEVKKIYNDINAFMAADGHAHTGNGSDGALLATLSLSGGTLTGVLNEALGTPIASASTINLTTATGNFLHITGTTTITAVTLGAGMRREVIFDGILTLTHHATNNSLPGGANVTTAAGDRASYHSDGTTVYCTNYQRADGTVLIPPTTRITTPIRQTVLAGAVDVNGFASQLQIGTGLAVNELATTVPTVTTWANGFDGNGAVDYVQRLTTTVTSAWSSLTANSTLYLYKERNATTGAVTYSFTTLVPVYQNYAPSAPATNQYWFDTVNMVGQYWSGSAWVLVQRVFVGECVTGVSTVTNVVSYAYQGVYRSAILTPIPNLNTRTLFNTNIGTQDIEASYYFQSLGAEGGYAVGERAFPLEYGLNSPTYLTVSPISIVNKNTISFNRCSTGNPQLASKVAGSVFSLTLVNWGLVIEAKRSW